MKNMRHFILGILFLVASTALLHAQTMRVTPDSGYDGISVTIVGIGTKFTETNNLSSVQAQVLIEQSGSNVGFDIFPILVNDSTISTTIETSALGWCGVEVKVFTDDTLQNVFTQDSAFKVIPQPPKITSVYPAEVGHAVPKLFLTIGAQSTNFDTGLLPTISFQQDWRHHFYRSCG